MKLRVLAITLSIMFLLNACDVVYAQPHSTQRAPRGKGRVPKSALSVTTTPNSILRIQINPEVIQGDPLNQSTTVKGAYSFLTETRTFDLAIDGVSGTHTVVWLDYFIRNDSYDTDFVVDIYKRDALGNFTSKVDTSLFEWDADDGWVLKNAIQSQLLNSQGQIMATCPKTHYCFCRNIQMTAGYLWAGNDFQLIVPKRYGDWYWQYTARQFFVMDNLPVGDYTKIDILDPLNLVGQREIVSFPVHWDGSTLARIMK